MKDELIKLAPFALFYGVLIALFVIEAGGL